MFETKYRGRIAPTPTGYLHLGHAATFSTAYKRAKAADGEIIFRNEDLDPHRCKPEFIQASIDDLKACGLSWDEGPDVGGLFSPYNQSEKLSWFSEVWLKLKETDSIYPCDKSRKDIQEALTAPHNNGSEAIFPKELRPIYINLDDYSERFLDVLGFFIRDFSRLSVPPDLDFW